MLNSKYRKYFEKSERKKEDKFTSPGWRYDVRNRTQCKVLDFLCTVWYGIELVWTVCTVYLSFFFKIWINILKDDGDQKEYIKKLINIFFWSCDTSFIPIFVGEIEWEWFNVPHDKKIFINFLITWSRPHWRSPPRW